MDYIGESNKGRVIICARVSSTVIHVFSCRIDGLRKYKKKIVEDDKIAKSIQDGN